MYRNDCRLTCWNQNCDIPIRFRMPVCQMIENRQFSAESQHNFHFLPHFNSKTTEPIFTIFTRCRAISEAINACICKTMVHFVSEHETKEWIWSILTSAKIPQNYFVTIETSLGLLRNLCQFYNPHTYVYQCSNVGEDWFSSCWDIW